MASMVQCILVFVGMMVVVTVEAQISTTLMPMIDLRDPEIYEFRDLTNRIGRKISDAMDLNNRLNNFKRAKSEIANLQSRYKGATFGVNKFALMSKEEQRKFFGTPPPTPRTSSTAAAPSRSKRSALDGTYTTSIPTSFDFRTLGKVSPIRDQKQCGSCWAFSATAAIESQYLLRQNLSSIDLSEQDLVNCKANGGGCSGENVAQTFAKVDRDGIAKEACQPYTAVEGKCGTCERFGIDGYQSFGCDEKKYAEKLYNFGPAVTTFQINDAFMYYTGGVLDAPAAQCNTNYWHAIVLVGYTADYWIAKNSWDTWWGENGYVRFKRGQNYCSFTTEVVAPYLNSTGPPLPTTTTTTTTKKTNTTTTTTKSSTPTTKTTTTTKATTTTKSAASACVDIATNCATNAAQCFQAAYLTIMKTKCQKTCGYCQSQPSSTCFDTDVDCISIKSYCSDVNYQAYMQGYCKKTCGFC